MLECVVEPYKEGLRSEWGIRKYNLDELYVRFLRVAERRIVEGIGRGVACFISSYSYLNPIDCFHIDIAEVRTAQGKLPPRLLPAPVLDRESDGFGARDEILDGNLFVWLVRLRGIARVEIDGRRAAQAGGKADVAMRTKPGKGRR